MTIQLDEATILLPLRATHLPDFHALATDPHIRRYLLDGEVLPESWAAEQIALSQMRVAETGLGLFLVVHRGERAGFAGFMALPGTGIGVELIFALKENFTGQGLATKIARALIRYARNHCPETKIRASVDAVNQASVKVLERLGFIRTETKAGAFGDLFVYEAPYPVAISS